MKYPQPLTTFIAISINAEQEIDICESIYDNKVIKQRPLQVAMSCGIFIRVYWLSRMLTECNMRNKLFVSTSSLPITK